MNLPAKTVPIPLDKIRVINSRDRAVAKFREIVESIRKLGMKEPIVVCRQTDGEGYDLICGEGRVQANQKIGRTEVRGIVLEVTLEDVLLISLVDNLGRRNQTTVESAREFAAMKERGHSAAAIASKVGLSDTYITGALRLLESGEERLVDAAERGEIPMSIAIDIARLDDKAMQRSLADAYGSEKLRGKAMLRVRRIIEQRKSLGKDLRSRPDKVKKRKPPSPESLIRMYRKEASRRESLVKRSRFCEEQLRFLLRTFKVLFKDKAFVSIVKAEKLSDVPKKLLEAVYHI